MPLLESKPNLTITRANYFIFLFMASTVSIVYMHIKIMLYCLLYNVDNSMFIC